MLAGVVGLSVANIFLSFYEAAAETVLLCFGEDRRLHRGVAEFAPRKLLAVLGQEVRMPPTCFFVCLCSIWGRRSFSPPFFAKKGTDLHGTEVLIYNLRRQSPFWPDS